MKDYQPPNTEWYKKEGLTPPETIPHGLEEDVQKNLKPLKTWGWKQEGDQLSCQTDMGVLCQKIPTSHILIGEDSNGKPILKKIEV